MNAKDKLIFALDFSSKQKALAFLKPLQKDLKWVKVGMELFYKEGSPILYELKEMGFSIFLDLKLHDIPSTVEKATLSLLEHPIDMLNFHIAGGSEMLNRLSLIRKDSVQFIGVTQLTSTSEERMQKELGISGSMKDTLLNYAKMAHTSGLNGVVCSPQDLVEIKEKMPDLICVCPGIRRKEDQNSDQVRVMTPAEAIENGADYLVIGRPIREAIAPLKVFNEIIKEMQDGAKSRG